VMLTLAGCGGEPTSIKMTSSTVMRGLGR
jgi:hypothetical protein